MPKHINIRRRFCKFSQRTSLYRLNFCFLAGPAWESIFGGLSNGGHGNGGGEGHGARRLRGRPWRMKHGVHLFQRTKTKSKLQASFPPRVPFTCIVPSFSNFPPSSWLHLHGRPPLSASCAPCLPAWTFTFNGLRWVVAAEKTSRIDAGKLGCSPMSS